MKTRPFALARPLALVLSVALVAPPIVLSAPGAAWAQPKPKTTREQLPLEARGHWDAGVALVSKKNWDAARSSFMAAYDISKNPRVLFNVGVVEKEAGRYAAALEAFQRELSEGKGQLTAAEEGEVKQVISSLQGFVAKLTIDVSEKDADVFIDNDKVDSSKLPGPLTVAVGERRVRATKPGFAEAVESVRLAGGGDSKVTLKLQPLVKTTKVNVSVVGPQNAIVKIDGKEVGPAPYSGQVPVTADPHEFSAEAPGFVAAKQSALLHDNEALNLTLQLAAEQAKGKLIVTAKPDGATIEIDGQVAGATRWEGPVDAKVHQIVVKKQGYYPWSYDVDVPKGGERSVSTTLNEDRNTSFVPWMVGTIVIGAAVIAGIVLVSIPNDQVPAKGNLAPFVTATQSFHPRLGGAGGGSLGGAGFHF